MHVRCADIQFFFFAALPLFSAVVWEVGLSSLLYDLLELLRRRPFMPCRIISNSLDSSRFLSFLGSGDLPAEFSLPFLVLHRSLAAADLSLSLFVENLYKFFIKKKICSEFISKINRRLSGEPATKYELNN